MIVGLVPTWSDAIDERTVRLAEEFLADTGHPAALRRLIDEGRADMVRALRARATDTGNGADDS